MRFRLTLAVVAAFIGSSPVPAPAQAPAALAPTLAPAAINRGGAGWPELLLGRPLELRRGKYHWLSGGAILVLERAAPAGES